MPFTLKDYTDIKEFATGGMSKIYSAVQISLNRTVIIKEMASGLLTTKSEIKRFENEARACASLTHDNIIRIYDFGEEILAHTRGQDTEYHNAGHGRSV